MNQHLFNFAKDPVVEQLELFSEDTYDNRIQRLNYSLQISYRVAGWRPYKLDTLTECVKLFHVTYNDVINEYRKLLQSESLRLA